MQTQAIHGFHAKFSEWEISYYCTWENSNEMEGHFLDPRHLSKKEKKKKKVHTFFLSFLFVYLFKKYYIFLM